MLRVFAPYRVLGAMPGTLRFLAAGFLARLGMAMFAVSIIVMISTRRDSYAIAGLVSFFGVMAMAIGGPLLARLVDRYGQRTVALPCGLVAVSCLVALAIETYVGAPTWVLILTNLGNAFAPAVGTLVRSRWAHLFTDNAGALHVANSFEQVLEESCFMIGPALGAGLAAWLFPEAGVLAAAILFVVGLLSLLAHRRSEPPIHVASGNHNPFAFRAPGLLLLALTLSLTGAIFGSMDVVIIAFAQDEGAKAWGGAVLGLFAGGSAVGGLLYGLFPSDGVIAGRLTIGVLAMFTFMIPLLWVPNLGVLAGNGLIVGVSIAPTLITAMMLAQRLVPASQLNEGMTIVITGLLIGVAVGSAVAGVAVEAHGAAWSFVVPLAAAATAAAIGVLGRTTLRRAEQAALAR